jgi:hypothetical protein
MTIRAQVCNSNDCQNLYVPQQLTAAPCFAAKSSTDSTDLDGTVEVAAQAASAVVLFWLP